MYFEQEYICYWSQAKDLRLSPAQTTAKVKCKLHSHYLYLLLLRKGLSTVVLRPLITRHIHNPSLKSSACYHLGFPLVRVFIFSDMFCLSKAKLRQTPSRHTVLYYSVSRRNSRALHWLLFAEWSRTHLLLHISALRTVEN
jgi:hypothetical protein